MLTQRADARAAKDWAAADRIRDAIAAAGIALEDGPDGTHWSLAGAEPGALPTPQNLGSH
jgi:cysteinyl-tRNA synthetase